MVLDEMGTYLKEMIHSLTLNIFVLASSESTPKSS